MLETVIIFFLCYFGLELAFYVYVQYTLLPSIQPIRSPQPCFFFDRLELAKYCLDLIKAMDTYKFEDFLTGWFLYCKIEDIYVENMDSWLAWVLFVAHFNDLSDDSKAAVWSFRKELCNKFNLKIQDGFNPEVKHCQFNLDKIKIIHHPLLEYVAFNLMEANSIFWNMYLQGFRKYKSRNGLTYWYKRHSYDTELAINKKPPILLLHGICSGWCSYAQCIRKFGKNRDVILVDYSCVRISWINLYVPDNNEINDLVMEILAERKIDKVSLVAHSWGTLICVWLMKMNPQIFSHICLIDPVGMVIFLPEPTHTLMYKPPMVAMDYAVCYFVRYNISTATAMYRNLCWYNVTCLLKDIPDGIGVVISIAGDDELVSAKAVKDLVNIENERRKSIDRSRKIVLLSFDKVAHGDTVLLTKSVDETVAAVEFSELNLESADSSKEDSLTVN